jgi:hypothetical protein
MLASCLCPIKTEVFLFLDFLCKVGYELIYLPIKGFHEYVFTVFVANAMLEILLQQLV